ncbi:hypothetical protein Tco_1201090 [Tanacetum coccineum]
MESLPPRAERHLWLRYEGQEYTNVIIQDFKEKLSRILGRQVHMLQVLDYGALTKEMDQAINDRLRMDHTECDGKADSLREIATKADLLEYWYRISSDGDFFSMVPSYTSIRDPLRRLCHRLIAFSIFGKGEEVGASMFGGYFVARLAEHFRLITEESLRGLIVAWVAPGPERQQVAAARATLADQEIPKEGVLADPAPAQAPTTVAPAPRTVS